MNRKKRLKIIIRAIARKQSKFFKSKQLAYDIPELNGRGVGHALPDLERMGLIEKWNKVDKIKSCKAGTYERLFNPDEVNKIIYNTLTFILQRYQDYSRVAGAQRCKNHYGLHPYN